MPQEVTRRRFMVQALGMIGGVTVSGDLLPLLAEAAQRKQVLRVAIERDFETLRPDLSAGDTNWMLRRLIYTTPILWGMKQRSDGSLIYDTDSLEMVLATAYKVSDDRQLIEFTLRPNAKFANGDPINAQALQESYAWFLGAKGSGQLRVNGLPSADRIEVVDEVTVRLHLDRPVAWGLIGNALLSSSSIVHAKEILKHATADDPFGTKWLETKTVESGAFIIETWQHGSMMSLVPNPHASQPVTLTRIILQIVPDASTRRIVLERGDVDFALQIATKDIPDLRKAPGVKVSSYPSARGWWLGMTWRKAPFNNIHFRRAMAWAMPYETLLQVVTQGLAERARSCVPNNISGYAGDFWPYETSLEKARAELAQVQVPDGFTVTVPVYAGDLFDEEATVLIKESLAPLGITLTLQKMPIGQKRLLLTQKQVDMAVYDWRPWVPDAGYFIYWNWLPDSFTNYWSYSNPEAQTLGNEAITMPVGSPEREATLRRFQEIVNGDIGLVPLFTQFDNIVMRENVQGYVYYPDTIPVLAKMSLG
jgi:peptide/nickel transport system substrate-binding protein